MSKPPKAALEKDVLTKLSNRWAFRAQELQKQADEAKGARDHTVLEAMPSGFLEAMKTLDGMETVDPLIHSQTLGKMASAVERAAKKDRCRNYYAVAARALGLWTAASEIEAAFCGYTIPPPGIKWPEAEARSFANN